MRRDDLVGAIMRVTGGNGIAASMADTLPGEKANAATKLRGLFTSQGQADMDDLAMLLREEEGFDVRDASHLEDLIREVDAQYVHYGATELIHGGNADEIERLQKDAARAGLRLIADPIRHMGTDRSADILRAMQAQITAEREKRAVIATSEGKRQEQINLADGQKQAAIAKSEGEQQAQINNAQGEAAAILAVAEATAQALERVGQAIRQPGGEQAVQLKVAERAVEAYGKVAQDAATTLVVPSNMTEVSALITSAMKMVQSQKPVL